MRISHGAFSRYKLSGSRLPDYDYVSWARAQVLTCSENNKDASDAQPGSRIPISEVALRLKRINFIEHV